MDYNINSDDDLDALFRDASEAVQQHYQSTLRLSADPGQSGGATDEPVSVSNRLTGDFQPALNRPDSSPSNDE